MKKRVLLTLLMLITLVALLVIPADAASDSAEVQIGGIEDYDAVNEVLRLMNTARAEEGLPPLKMDPALSQWAMQRAAECSVYYSHTRPDGTSCFSILSGDHLYYGAGENIAIGHTSAASVNQGWLNSPGHRANIMNSNYQTVGIGCFYQENGTKSWVQLFSSKSANAAYNKSGKTVRTDVPLRIAKANLNVTIASASNNTLQLYQGQSLALNASLRNAAWEYATPVALTGGYSVTSSNPSVCKIARKTLKAVAPGTATATITLNSVQYSKKITVNVVKMPVITHKYDQSNSIFSWTGSSSLILFYKEKNADTWFYGSSNNAFYHSAYSTSPGEIYTYQLRYWNGSEYVDAGKPVTKHAPVLSLETPVPTVSNDASGNPTLTWKAIAGAVKYKIYRASSTYGSFQTYKTVTVPSFTDTGLALNTTYYYKVEAISANGVTACSSSPVSGTRTLGTLTATAENIAASGKIKLSWNTLTGAVKYNVYRASTKNGTYTLLKTVAASSFTDTNAKTGTKYFYKVEAIPQNPDTLSVYSAVISRTADLTAPKVTASNVAVTGKVKLSWKAVSGAIKYVVYRATDKNGKFVKIGTTANTTYICNSTKAGTAYYYKVVAVHKNTAANSAYSAAVLRTVDLAQPNVDISRTGANPNVSWNKVKGAVKYQVLRSTAKNGTYKLIKTTTGVSFVDTTAKTGQIYYYKVRSVCKVNAGNSALSLPVHIRAK